MKFRVMFFPATTVGKLKEGLKKGARKLKEKTKQSFGEVNRLLVGGKEIRLSESTPLTSPFEENSSKIEFLNFLSRQLVGYLTSLGFVYSFTREYADPKHPQLILQGTDKLVLKDQNYAYREDIVVETSLSIIFGFETSGKTQYLVSEYFYNFKDEFLQPQAEEQFKRLHSGVKSAIKSTKNQEFFIIV